MSPGCRAACIMIGFWTGLANLCPNVFPWHKEVMGCSLADVWWPSIALLLMEQIYVNHSQI